MSHTIRLFTAALLVTAMAAACTGEPPPPAAPPSGSAAPSGADMPAALEASSDSGSELMQHMHEHYARLAEIRSAIAMGDSARVEIAAYWLARHASPERIPDGWEPYATQMRQQAERMEAAREPAAILAAADALQAACAACHEANGIDVALPPALSPIEPPAMD